MKKQIHVKATNLSRRKFIVGSAAASGGLDIGSIIGQVISGGAGGGVLMAIVGLIRSVMAK